VVVAVVDSGVNTANAHLRDAVTGGVNVVRPQEPATVDAYGHGTTTGGIIAARRVDGSGLVGVAPAASLLVARVFYGEDEQSERDGVADSPERIAAGIRWAAENGARIINVSMSTTADLPELHAAVDAATTNGALVVASVGNLGTSEVQADVPRYPAAYPGVLAVTGVGLDGTWVPGTAVRGEYVDVAAPGQDVLSAFAGGGDCRFDGSAPSTSWATAYVSGAAALVAARYPHEAPAQWAHRLMVTASRTQPWERDDQVGWGIIQPYEALIFVDDGSAPGPQSPVFERADPPPAATSAIDLSETSDPMIPARQLVMWWLLGGAAFLCIVMLLARMGRSAPRRR
ncbi:MAG: S8 family serine peptidase, partial [Actinomycetales bacterium]|nr:S8 family serine peptidase [Actinomycetales bacterium]